jgi:hypothetical protein
MTNNEGAVMDIYDYVEADTLGDIPNEQIVHENDYIELTDVIKSSDSVMVKGYSHVSGDSVVYILGYDTEVGLWAV